MPAPSVLSHSLQLELHEKLDQLLDEADRIRSAREAVSKAFGGEARVVSLAIARTRQMLKGAESAQLEVPGTGTGERRADPVVARLLAAAEKLQQQAKAPLRDPDPLAPLVGTRQEAIERHRGAKASTRDRGQIVRWCIDQRAKRPPLFVIEQTGLKTKAALIAKYGEGATFEMAKPPPETKATADARRGASPKKAAKSGVCRTCRCTDSTPCLGGCTWTDATHTLCTACDVGGVATRKAVGRS